MNTMPIEQLKKTMEFARIHAHVSADGYLSKCKCRRTSKELLSHPRINLFKMRYSVAYVNTDPVLAKEFINDTKKLFDVKAVSCGKFEYRISAKWIYDLMRDSGALMSDTWFIPSFILNGSREVKSAWLKAFFDDEGYFYKNQIGLRVANKNGIKAVQLMLLDFGIQTKLYQPRIPSNPKYKIIYQISIRRENLIKYYNEIGFSHPNKQQKLICYLTKKVGLLRFELRSEALEASIC